MPYTGLTIDSTTNGVDFITTTQTGLTATITDEVLQISGTGARLNGAINITRSQVSVFNPINRNGSLRGQTSAISYVNSQTVTDTTNIVAINQSSLSFESTSPSIDGFQVLLSQVVDSIIAETGIKNKLIVYAQPNCVLSNSQISNVNWLEFTGNASQFSGITISKTYAGIVNYGFGRIDLIGISIPSTLSVNYVAVLAEAGANTSFVFWNPVNLDFTKLLMTSTINSSQLGYTVSWKIKDSNPTNDALVVYRDDRANIGGAKTELARYTTDSTGTLVGTYDSKLGVTGSNVSRPTLWVRTQQTRQTGGTVAQSPSNVMYSTENIGGQYVEKSYVVDLVSCEIEIRSYLHLALATITSPSTQIGTINDDSTVKDFLLFILTVDTGITQTNRTTAAAVTGIAHTATTITVSISHSIAEIYDSRKAYWRDNGGTPGVRIGAIADFGNINITIATGVLITPSFAKFLDGLQTSGIITLTDPKAYNGVPFSVASGGSITALAGGNFNIQGWIGSGTTISSSAPSIFTVDSSQINNFIAGTNVTLQTPQANIRFHGMPNVSNTILFVQDLTTNAIIYPTIANGEAIVTVNAARNYKIRADAPGYLASPFVTISGASVDYQFGLTDYRALYLSGVNRSSQITFNPTTYLITISDLTPTLSFADVFVTIEDYLATPQGLNYTAHPYPVVLSDRNILQFPYDTTTNAVNPARIKPAVGNTTDPALLFETYLERAADPSYGLFDFSTSNGRIIRIRSVVAIAQIASATIAPTSQQIRDALTIPASSTVVAGSIDSKLALIPTIDASISIAAIKTQTDKFVFTTVGRVDATAIGVPTNPLVTTDSRLSNLDALVSSRATQASINALPTLTAIEGSIVLFKSSNYTAPDNAGIGSLNSKLTSARADGLDRLPNLDALITSRATTDQVWAVPYAGLTQTGTIGRLLYWIGKLFGATSTTVTASNTARTTGDGTINQTITTNPDGSKTMSGNP